MGPERRLAGDALRFNAAVFAALGAPVAAVVKLDGYGWGARNLARELDPMVESYVVNDADELAALRPATEKTVRLLTDVPAHRLARVLDMGGIPNVSTRDALAAAIAEAGRRGSVTVRVGVHDAAGWSAIRPADAPEFAATCRGSNLIVELWTHISSYERSQAQLDALLAARAAFDAAGVRVAGIDAASTASARRELAFDRLRIGVGLFGSRLGASVETRCAVRLTAPVVRRFAPGEIAWAGYGETPVAEDRGVVVLRCGYGDGFARGIAGTGDILSIGMQYTARVRREGFDPSELIGESDDVDAIAARAGISSHELVVGLASR